MKRPAAKHSALKLVVKPDTWTDNSDTRSSIGPLSLVDGDLAHKSLQTQIVELCTTVGSSLEEFEATMSEETLQKNL